MTLQQLTKSQLIEIINKHIDSHRIKHILNTMEYERRMALYDQADKLLEEAIEHLRAYREFTEKYDGVPVTEIPYGEFQTARNHYAQYLKLDEQHDRIMAKESEYKK